MSEVPGELFLMREAPYGRAFLMSEAPLHRFKRYHVPIGLP